MKKLTYNRILAHGICIQKLKDLTYVGLYMIILIPANHIIKRNIRMVVSLACDCSFTILDGSLRTPVNAGQAHLTMLAPYDLIGMDGDIIFRAYLCAEAATIA